MKKIYFISLLMIISCSKNHDSIDTKQTILQEDQKKINQTIKEKVHDQIKKEEFYGLIRETVKDSLNILENTAADLTYNEIDCGTRLTARQYDRITDIIGDLCKPELVPEDQNTMLTFPLQVFIIANRKNKLSINGIDFQNSLKVLNEKYQPAKINFIVRSIETIVNDNFYDFSEKDEGRMLQFQKPNVINIFITNTLRDKNDNKLNGYTSYEQRDNFIILRSLATKNGTTFAHEMGHFFFLYHTHGKVNLGYDMDQLVSGKNCSCVGDDICDTPADPNLLDIVGCIYNGNIIDNEGSLFNPDPRNIMSYAHDCRNIFTLGQYNRIRWMALNYRDYLLVR